MGSAPCREFDRGPTPTWTTKSTQRPKIAPPRRCCRAAGHEPPAKAAAVSLGFLDRSKAPLTVDEALTTVACARELAAMDG